LVIVASWFETALTRLLTMRNLEATEQKVYLLILKLLAKVSVSKD